jgi:hypothetical protein
VPHLCRNAAREHAAELAKLREKHQIKRVQILGQAGRPHGIALSDLMIDGSATPRLDVFLAASQFKTLIRHRHFDTSIAKMCRKLGHAVFLAMDEKGPVRAGLLLPSQ